MKNHLFIDCETVLDTIYNSDNHSSLPLLNQLRIWLHLMFCSACSIQFKEMQNIENIMRSDFFPPSPDFEDILMVRLSEDSDIKDNIDAPVAVSFRLWVIIGFFVLLSLSSSFFGMNFVEIANSEGLSFLLPVGLTFGLVVTCYGALLIGSHLKELSTRFKL